MRGRFTALVASSASVLALLAPQTANAADTIVTFTVTSGALTISAPASPVSIGQGAPGTTFGQQIGTVTVDDLRGANPASWIASVSSTAYTATGVPAIPASAMMYTPEAGTTTGNGTITPGATGPMTNLRVAFTYSGGTGSSTTSWAPDLDITVPLTATATTYTGTVTHSVT
jgi:hypothetical protein